MGADALGLSVYLSSRAQVRAEAAGAVVHASLRAALTAAAAPSPSFPRGLVFNLRRRAPRTAVHGYGWQDAGAVCVSV
jgi:hypothetical protein